MNIENEHINEEIEHLLDYLTSKGLEANYLRDEFEMLEEDASRRPILAKLNRIAEEIS